MYQPELGRFLQPDPKQFDAGDYNLYRYCHNDPVNRSDPFGLDDALKFFKAIGDFLKRRADAQGVDSKAVGEAVVADAKEAGSLTKAHTRPGRGPNTSTERAFARYAKDGTLVRTGPATGKNYGNGSETDLPSPPRGMEGTKPLTGSHSHGAQNGFGFRRMDIPSANGAFTGGTPYISAVSFSPQSGEPGERTTIFIPGANGGTYFHEIGGEYFTGK
jgi:uncharacterized protein RhaS with RHS repeats